MKLEKIQTHSAHNSLPHIDHVRALHDDDMECLEELRSVLEKHDRLDRFGIALLHKHFDLQSNEILVEETDEEQRCQTVRAVPKDRFNEKLLMPTIFALGREHATVACYRECVWRYPDGPHQTMHNH